VTFQSGPKRGKFGPALAISLLLHVLLLWPVADGPAAIDVREVLTATLQPPAAPPSLPSPPSPSPVFSPSPLSRAPQQKAKTPRDPPPILSTSRPAVDAVPWTNDALQRSENPPSVAAVSPPASPAFAPAGDSRAEGVREYRLSLATQARRYKRYPPRAMEAGVGGTAEIRIAVAAEGRATEVLLARSSGDDTLDAAALEMMRKAAPRTPVPESLRDRSFAVNLPIVFDPATE
jgi:protein TonB